MVGLQVSDVQCTTDASTICGPQKASLHAPFALYTSPVAASHVRQGLQWRTILNPADGDHLSPNIFNGYSTLSDPARFVPTTAQSTEAPANKFKKRQSFALWDDKTGEKTRSAQAQSIYADERKADATIGHHTPTGRSLQDETVPSSFTYSSPTSRLPSMSTPGSSPSVQPVRSRDEELATQQMATPVRSKPKQDEEEICTSPTWKDTLRKERRATKRLEAERKELEKRLIHLEEAQARLENGVFDRNARRLTKKQPLGSSNRSTSASSDRPRSSGTFSALFSRSRQSSRSRASSVNATEDRNQRHSSDGQTETDTLNGPPSLPLTLPERFGAAVSRELATRHGTSLMSSQQLQRSPHMLHHTMAKSDDLRENWKMAEAWKQQDQDSGHEPKEIPTSQKTEYIPSDQSLGETFQRKNESESYLSNSKSPVDLDRELFTANLRHERKPSGGTNPFFPPLKQRTPRAQSTQPPSKKLPHSQGQPNSQLDPLPAQVSSTRRPHDLHGVPPESVHGPYHARNLQPSSSTPGNLLSDLAKKSRGETQTNTYKSSPLALNPFTMKDATPKHESQKATATPASEPAENSLVPQPLRFSQTYNFEEPRGRSRQSTSANVTETQDQAKNNTRHGQQRSFKGPTDLARQLENQPPKTSSFDLNQKPHTSEGARPAHAFVPPLKHPGRRLSISNNSPGWVGNRGQSIPTIVMTEATDTSSHEAESTGRSPPAHDQATFNNIPAKKSTGPSHSRSSSHDSGASSYDTADEEVLDTPNHPGSHQSTSPKTETTNSGNSIPEALVAGKSSPSYAGFQGNFPLSRNGVVTMMRKNPLQNVKQPKQDQLIAKLFVICCQCRYWHDFPSELYAKLACPERLPSESLLGRTFSRGNSFKRRTSFRNSMFGGLSSEPYDRRHLSVPKRTQPPGSIPSSQSPQLPENPISCCWCGHSMAKSCCQGWTTLVKMRERHH
ncbi:hypothetical protein N7462_000236 [Penicillium macrosclerotiorum]|uniref:uncharacterized protein n=1 Tax=Penicillium macrosclerotiorum TaxID=303699 RepID=UPI0025483D0C|nr:uncharacterized protein N7462_000236 [Penicillium macrosclerotiorum]KAJ5698231.1 hypothetical protein N7462_000236 [Penicillium macrosclerotiorum]